MWWKAFRLLCFAAIIFSSAPMAFANDAGEVPVMLQAPPGLDFSEWRAELKGAGIYLRHAFPPAGGIAYMELPKDGTPIEQLVPPGTRAWADSPAESVCSSLLVAAEGKVLWHAHRALLGVEQICAPPADKEGSPLINDALVPPILPTEGVEPLGTCSATGLKRSGSEYLLGSVSVNLILPESNGAIDTQTENWDSTRETNVNNEVVAGLNSLANLYTKVASLKPSFTYHVYYGRTDSRAQTSYEPIVRSADNMGDPGTGEGLWVREILAKFGYSTSLGKWDMGREFNGDTRTSDGTDWAFTIFVVDSLNDSDGMFADGAFGYAWLGGPYVVMTYDNDGWGISRLDYVTRHEAGHIFYADDEYSASGCACTDSSGYVTYVNQNCQNSCTSNVSCVMRDNVAAICSYTSGMIGWGDSDADTIPDPVDIAPQTALTAYSPDPTTNTTLTYNGTATIQKLTNQNIYGYICDINILTIANVQWRVDGGSWSSATPSDGAFNGATENYTFTTGILSSGTHTIETRAVDELGQADASFASDTVTVNSSCAMTVDVTPNGTTTVCTGAGITFTATRTGGTAPFTYQWTEGGTNITGATNSTYTANKASAGSFAYNCKVTDSSGSCVNVQDATASTGTWVAPPSLVNVTPNGTTTACIGSGIVFTATVTGGATPLYQWTEGGTNISGATNSTYTANKASAGTFSYNCKVNNTGCATTVQDATASTGTWVAPPSVDVTPNGTTAVCTAANIVFTATATGGTGPYSYQWTEGGTNISGATNSTYTANKAAAGSFAYNCKVNSTGCATQAQDATSSTGTWVAPPSLVNVTPNGTTTACTGANIIFTVTVTGGATPIYQWTEGGVNITGATNSTYTATKFSAGTFSYNCKVHNTGCATTVQDATASTGTWVSPPTVDVTPNGTTTVTVGNSITFTATATAGAAPYGYQWTEDGSNISGATTSTLTRSYGTVQSHTYNCKVTSTGCATTAQDATAPVGQWQAGTPPGEVASQSWADKTTHTWSAASGSPTGYKLQRGQRAAMPNLLNSSDDSCKRYDGPGTTASSLTENPASLSAGDFYWYLVVAYNASGDGSAGSATAGPRIVNGSTICP